MDQNLLNLEELFCKKCLYILKICGQIDSQKDEEEPNTKITIQENDTFCHFCFGILNEQNFNSIIGKIQNEMKHFEHKDYKITTNFSPLFHLVHSYVNIFYKNFSGN